MCWLQPRLLRGCKRPCRVLWQLLSYTACTVQQGLMLQGYPAYHTGMLLATLHSLQHSAERVRVEI